VHSSVYPIVFLDALRVKIRDAESRQVKNKAVYVALGVNPDGEREVLGWWIAVNEGAKFWLSIMNNLKNRGLEDILIAVVDGLKGFPDAINAAFPDTTVQTCIVHLVRHSLNFCGWPLGDASITCQLIERPQVRSQEPEANLSGR
jgi:putative transposase